MVLTPDIDKGSPIKVTGTTSADEEILDRPVYIKFVYWYNPTTAGDLFVLKDGAGGEIVEGRCETDGESQWLPVFTGYDSIRSDDVDSGTLYIYIS